jgi:uncharacterized lipoprotein YmbA
VLVLGCAISLMACAAPRVVRFHTLVPEAPPQPIATPVNGKARLPIVLERIRVPASVDQPQWLVRLPDHSLALLEQDRWASPLPDELHRALAERLQLRYGMQEAQTPGQRQDAVRIRIDVTRFESIPGQAARIDANWTVTPRQSGRALSCSLLIREPVEAGIAALAAGQRQAVERLGDAIGAQLLALQSGEVPTCPAPVEMNAAAAANAPSASAPSAR